MNDIRQEDMAGKLRVSRATLINYEKGHTAINVDILERFEKNYPDFDSKKKSSNKSKLIDDSLINFGVVFNVLSASWKSIVLVSSLASVLGLSFSFMFTKYYSSQITLYPAKKDTMQSFGQFQSLASNLGMNMPDNNQSFNITDVVKSKLISNKVLNEQWLSKDNESISLYQLWDMDKTSWLSQLNLSEVDSAYLKEKAISNLSNHIEVTEDRLSGLITIKVILEEPVISASIANFIGEQVQRYIQKENSAQSTKEKLFIKERLYIVKKELELSELALKEFKERNRGYQDSPDLFMVFSRFFRDLEAKKQIYLMLQQELELVKIEEVKKTPILHILDHAIPPARKSSPNRVSFMIISFLLGLMFSSLSSLSKY